MSSEQEKTPLRTLIDAFCEDNWPDEDILVFGNAEGSYMDEGFLGVGYQHTRGPLAIYDREKCIEALAMEFSVDTSYADDDDADAYTDAVEFFEFNTAGSWVGEETPIIISRFDAE
jgi:hypothetical protein